MASKPNGLILPNSNDCSARTTTSRQSISGWMVLQSEDIARQVERMTPLLQPDLIVYGVCLNDFLPSGVGQYSRFAGPLPEWFKSMSLNRTRLADLLADGYAMLLLALGIRADFYGDTLADFQGYQERFGRDLAHMNEFAQRRGLSPDHRNRARSISNSRQRGLPDRKDGRGVDGESRVRSNTDRGVLHEI